MQIKHIDVPFAVKQEDMEENGVFVGYASVFGGKPDAYGDIIAPGAFAETLEAGGRNGSGIKMLYQHWSDKPLGVWNSLEENKKGLKVEGQIAMKTQLGSESYELMKLGAIDGLSIGFDVEEYEVDEKRKITTLKKINLWEISLVTFPACVRATVTQVKTVIEKAQNVRELEHGLRELGLSRDASVYLASLCKNSLSELRMTGTSEIHKVLQKLNKMT